MGGDIEATFVSVGILSILVTSFLIIVAIDTPIYAEAMERPAERMEAFRENLRTLSLGVANVQPPQEVAREPSEDLILGGPLGFVIPGSFFDFFGQANPFGFVQGFARFVTALFGVIINGFLGAGALVISLFEVLSWVPLGIGLIFGTISAFSILYFSMQFLTAFIGAIKPI